ncbi:MAG TPA: DUF885 domain-containing protein [Steroidobacteraceae bacterium]|jgi:hypothetical protein|nr:DUF885 domain-containing protein [Steroidobacteraceae bacterium]
MCKRWIVSLVAVVCTACGVDSQPGPAHATGATQPTGQSGWSSFSARYIEDYFSANPLFAVRAGRHEFDGRMADWSAHGIAAEVKRLQRMRSAALAFDAATLTASELFEREQLLTVIDTDLFWLDRARSPFTNPAWYIDQLDPDVYLNRDYAPLATRLSGYIGYLRAIPQIAADIRANLKVPMPPTFAERGIQGFGGFAVFFRTDAPKVFSSIRDTVAQTDLAEASTAAAAAMDGLKVWLTDERTRAAGSYALGEPLFLEMLSTTERVNLTIKELLAAGKADLERNSRALAEACALYSPKETLQECVDKARADKPAGGAVEGARAQLADLRSFIVQKGIVTIPGEERPLVAEAPPYNRANAAYINIPGPLEHGIGATYCISPPDPSWSAKEREEYLPGRASLLFTSVHEVWPGHFLQFLHSNRNPSKIAALWVGYAYAEGWAHYSEEMMWEEGLGAGDPEQHIGQLTAALLRDARFLSAIGLHAQGMTVEDSERLFRQSAYSDPGNAHQQAARGTYDPEYLKYTLGKLMIRKLRADWVARQPAPAGADPRLLWHGFHDKFLSYGGPPIPLVRTAMLGEAGSVL